jgi:hypothetical protein
MVSESSYRHYVRCLECAQQFDQATIADAANAWNRRATSSHAHLTEETRRQREEIAGLREQLTRMVDIAEVRLFAIDRALNPSKFGICGIESAEDHIDYMVSCLSSPVIASGEEKAEPSPSEQFAKWLEVGPKLAKAAGCYVGITVSPAPLSTPNTGGE